jgi:hypothetical protein
LIFNGRHVKILDPSYPQVITFNDDYVIVQTGADRVIVPKSTWEARAKLKKPEAVQKNVAKAFEIMSRTPSIADFGLATGFAQARQSPQLIAVAHLAMVVAPSDLRSFTFRPSGALRLAPPAAFLDEDYASRLEDSADSSKIKISRLALAVFITGERRGLADPYPRRQPDARPSEQSARGPDLLRTEVRFLGRPPNAVFVSRQFAPFMLFENGKFRRCPRWRPAAIKRVAAAILRLDG